MITEDDLDSAEEAARARGGLDEESVLFLVGQLRLLIRRERLRGVLMEHADRVEKFLERDEGVPLLSLDTDGAEVSFRKLRHYAGDGLWRYALHDRERLEKGKPLDPPLWMSRLTFR